VSGGWALLTFLWVGFMIVREWWAESAAGEVGHGDQRFEAVVAVGAAGEQSQVGVGGLGAGVGPCSTVLRRDVVPGGRRLHGRRRSDDGGGRLGGRGHLWMSLSRANSVTALRNRNPIFSRIAGDGIGNPR